MDASELKKKIEKYDKLAAKNYYLYQETGEPRYDKANEKYEERADVYRAAYKYQLEEDESRSRRLRNFSYFVKEHVEGRDKQSYTKGEVLEMAERMKQFVF